MQRIRLGLALAALPAALVLNGCGEKVGPVRTEGTRSARVDPRADEVLRQMSTALSGARSFSLRGTTTMDELLETGQLAQFSRETRILVRRPDRLRAEIRRDGKNWLVWYTGTSLTILDKSTNTCASAQVPGRIDDMLDEVAKKYDLTMPLADLLFSDAYKVLTADVLTGKYIGLHQVDGVKCSHLLFTQENVDWQLWIPASGKPLPVKLLIDYKNQPGRPQFAAKLSDWNLSAASGDEQFKPALPNDVKRVEMAGLLSADQEGN